MANRQRRKRRYNIKRIIGVIAVELLVIVLLIAGYKFVRAKFDPIKPNDNIEENNNGLDNNNQGDNNNIDEKLSPEELEARNEQERLRKENEERQNLIDQADLLTLSYDYDGAIDLIKSYQGPEGGYELYPVLREAIERYETEKSSLVHLGGSYNSVTEVNHIFFHSLIADNSKAFDGDYDSVGYNMYMTTIYEFIKMMEKMYEDGYVLVSIHDLVKQVTLEDGSTKFVEGEILLPPGKKPFVISQDDVNYYQYMEGDGFASRMVLDENGKVTCEMILDDGSVVTGPYDMVPILDDFVEKHPDFSYKGAKGIIALTGYEGSLGYRTNDPTSPTYEQDKETVKKVAEAMKANGWEFASHTWGHRDMSKSTFSFVKTDMTKWMEQVGSLVGPTDIIIFPYGIDIETTMGHYESDKYHFLKELGFNYFCGVYSKPWMHIKNDYVRMTRRPLDGQAMLQFPERLADLFNVNEVIDPERPARNW
ncbi:MAG: polysaccharide deacetylase [Clostridiales bacterium]|nr:polysaccharide deacetylase [Clostridiales bacterium]